MIGVDIAARLGAADCWVFDLDDTLYPRESGLWAQIDTRISAYVKKQLGLSDDAEVARLRRYFRQTYGGALKGLMEEYSVDTGDYLADVHDIDYSPLQPDAQLASDIANLNGRKYVFTNGDRPHAERALDRLGLFHCFEDIFDIAAAGFIPKPYAQAYDRFLNHFSINPAKTVMLEDNLANLATCKDLGMVTVLIGHEDAAHVPDYVDVDAANVGSFMQAFKGQLHG